MYLFVCSGYHYHIVENVTIVKFMLLYFDVVHLFLGGRLESAYVMTHVVAACMEKKVAVLPLVSPLILCFNRNQRQNCDFSRQIWLQSVIAGD